MKNSIFQLFSLLSIVLIINACSSSKEEVALPPAELSYTTNQIEIEEGQKASSSAPTLKGTKPFTFSITTNPATQQITIDNQGVVSVSENLGVGTYKVSITVSNSASRITFNDALTVNVKRKVIAPSNLVYSPNSVEVSVGTAISSAVPTIQGTLPISYTMTTSPITDRISIDNRGVISVANNLTAGTYNVSVTARNEAGSITFANAFSVIVKSVNTSATPPSNLAYSPNTINATQGTAISTNAPTVSGTSPFTFVIASANTANGQITINPSTGVINVGANTPVGAYTISITATNTGGSATFMSVLTINVAAPILPISFAKDIQPFLQVCGNCHTYNTYLSARTNANRMLDRIQRPQGSAGFMPQSGTPLTRAQIDLFQKWIDDGLKE